MHTHFASADSVQSFFFEDFIVRIDILLFQISLLPYLRYFAHCVFVPFIIPSGFCGH
jgi:hypothetical protein